MRFIVKRLTLLSLFFVSIISACSAAEKKSEPSFDGPTPKEMKVFSQLLSPGQIEALDSLDSPAQLTLEAKDLEVTYLPLGENVPLKGSKTPLVTVVVFSDYQCPYCSRHDAALEVLFDKYKDHLQMAFFHYPLPFHKAAKPAARAADAARLQGRFWDLHRVLFNAASLRELDLGAAAEALELDLEKFKEDLQSPDRAALVEANIKLGADAGVTGTPTIFINGVRIVGAVPMDKLEEIYLLGLGRAYLAMKQGVSVEDLYEYLTDNEIMKNAAVIKEGGKVTHPGFMGDD
jgi:protein-disulfide isomerase